MLLRLCLRLKYKQGTNFFKVFYAAVAHSGSAFEVNRDEVIGSRSIN